MQLYKDKKGCCGCGVCRLLCPTKSITMIEDDEGFSYPEINNVTCTECGICLKECFSKDSKLESPFNQEYYAVRHRDISELYSSQSGGAFIALAHSVLSNKGIVYGVGYDNLKVKHKRVIDKEGCSELKGSKYVQSDLGNIFIQVKKDLKDNKEVLFSGTPCQVVALSVYLGGVNKDKLILCDLICHGVPSPRIWKDYARYIEKKYKDKIYRVNFRDKEFGWDTRYESFIFTESKCKVKTNNYIKLFLKNFTLRPSCGFCKYSSFSRYSDITLGDFWEWEKSLPKEFNSDNKGISLVLVNTIKGKRIFNNIKNNVYFIQSDKKACNQRNLHTSTEHSPKRALFWWAYNMCGLLPILFIIRISDFVKKLVRGIFK